MHKLLKADLLLFVLTILGLLYLYYTQKISLSYSLVILSIYLLAKIIGYRILPYQNFEKFLNHLSNNSKLPFLSGFEIFKTTLVALLFFGFIFMDPAIWIIESILVVMMRIWGIAFIKNKYND
jgi:hypothetical protein